jgi:hypothetical protein
LYRQRIPVEQRPEAGNLKKTQGARREPARPGFWYRQNPRFAEDIEHVGCGRALHTYDQERTPFMQQVDLVGVMVRQERESGE